MSRTDKDRPYWVQINDPENGSHVAHDHRHGECRVAQPRGGVMWRWVGDATCVPTAGKNDHFIRWMGGVPAWYINHIWNAPERRRVREDLHGLAGLYNSGHDIDDTDFPNFQHRHCGAWYY